MPGERDDDRTLIDLSGKDALSFLQGLVTNDLMPLGSGQGIVWCALLSPQGKYLADFFVLRLGERLLIDVKRDIADSTLRRLSLYRLRADVRFDLSNLCVARGIGPLPDGTLADPRHPALGWRSYQQVPGSAPGIDWDALRVASLVPETGIELVPDETYILEAGFERLHGVDFRKGCYVGQEVTARMKHKTELRKGLARVRIEGDAPEGSEITFEGKSVGHIYTRSGDRALAHLRYDRASAGMQAGQATLWLDQTAA